MTTPPPPSHIAPAAPDDVDTRQMIEHFQRLDAYGRRVALAMLAALARMRG